jgi:hypothetical protein
MKRSVMKDLDRYLELFSREILCFAQNDVARSLKFKPRNMIQHNSGSNTYIQTILHAIHRNLHHQITQFL